MKWVTRVILGGLAALSVATVLLFGAARFVSVPIGIVSAPLELWLGSISQTRNVQVVAPKLRWSLVNNFYEINISKVSLLGRGNARIQLDDLRLAISGEGFWQGSGFMPAEIEIKTLTMVPENPEEFPFSTDQLMPDMATGGAGQINRFLKLMAIRQIIIGDTPAPADADSHLLLTRDDRTLRLIVSVAYRQGTSDSFVDAIAYFKPGEGGHADVSMSNINPRYIGRFSRFLAPLQGLQLPITTQISVDFDRQGQPTRGAVNLFIDPGTVRLAANSLQIDELVIALETDFSRRRVRMNDVRFDIGGIAGHLTGDANYAQTKSGGLNWIDLDLRGQGVRVNLPTHFDREFQLSRVNMKMAYQSAARFLEIKEVKAEHDFGKASLSGSVKLAENGPQFDLSADFGAMSREAAEAFWPLQVATKTRHWARANLIGGRLTAGTLKLSASLDELINRQRGTPLREDALQLDLALKDIGLRYLKDAPPLEQADIEMSLRGTSFRAKTSGGMMHLPTANGGQTPIKFGEGVFLSPDFRASDTASDIQFTASGQSDAVMRLLRQKPFDVTREIDFDFDRLQGDVAAKVRLQIPILAAPEDFNVTYQVSATTQDLSVSGDLGGFAVSKAQAKMHLDDKAMRISGKALVNGVDTQIQWQQPLGEGGLDKSKLTAYGQFTPQDIADLGQAWVATRFTGEMDAKVVVRGNLASPRKITVQSDLLKAKFMPRPLAYEKALNVPGRVDAVIRNNSEGQIDTVTAELKIEGEKPAAFKLKFDGPHIIGLDMQPISLGLDENLLISIRRENDNTVAVLSAEKLDVRKLLNTANKDVTYEKQPTQFLPFFGPNALVEGQIAQAIGNHGETLSGIEMSLVRRAGLHEKLFFNGTFKDSTKVTAALDRANLNIRNLSVRAENTGNILRLLDWQEEVYGGSLKLVAQLFDSGRNQEGERYDAEGRITMVDFRARNVPVLASMFTLASLTGIADTLSGDGIRFTKLQSDFSLKRGLLNIKNGRVHGPAVGLTMRGDYDLSGQAVDIGGTLVPAYWLNSLLGRIPLIGAIFGSRKGEGLLGIAYRLSGSGGKANVLVNPLSLLTPGFFRRIFEFGIGLSDDLDDEDPDMRDEDLTQ